MKATDKDIATIEMLHDALIECDMLSFDSEYLVRARELTLRMYAEVYRKDKSEIPINQEFYSNQWELVSKENTKLKEEIEELKEELKNTVTAPFHNRIIREEGERAGASITKLKELLKLVIVEYTFHDVNIPPQLIDRIYKHMD